MVTNCHGTVAWKALKAVWETTRRHTVVRIEDRKGKSSGWMLGAGRSP